MKNLLLFTILLVGLIGCKKETDYFVKYNFQYAPDSLNKWNLLSEEMILSTNAQGYAFMSNNIFKSDTIGDITKLLQENKLSFTDIKNLNSNDFQNLRLYFNKDSNRYHIQSSVDGLVYKFIDEVTPLNWDLQDEVKQIKNYKAKKAITRAFGKKWIAWYTEQIPVGYGPYKFQGLPGLIVELYDEGNNFKFDLVEAKVDTTHYPIYKKANEVNSKRSEFEDKIKAFKNNPERISMKTGDNVAKDKELLERRKKQIAKKNNAIENGLQFNL